MKGIQHTLLSYAAAAVFLLALWWAIALLLALPIVPTPDKVLVRLAHVFSRDIFAHAAWSLWRIAAGLGLAVCIGYPLGVLMGYFRRADRYLSPVVYLTYPIPKIALLPILMLLAGVGELSKILMIFLIIVFQVIVAVRDAIRTLPEERYAPLYSLGAAFAGLPLCHPARILAEVHHGRARRDGDGCLRAVLHRDVRHAVRHGLLHHGRLAARQLPRDVRGHPRPQRHGPPALRPHRRLRARGLPLAAEVRRRP